MRKNKFISPSEQEIFRKFGYDVKGLRVYVHDNVIIDEIIDIILV